MKVVPEGYNGAGMNYGGGNRRDVNGKANAGLTLGIIDTAFDGLALFGNRRSTPASILGGAGGGGNISKGIISLEVPYVNKIVALNQTDLEILKESLISLKTK